MTEKQHMLIGHALDHRTLVILRKCAGNPDLIRQIVIAYLRHGIANGQPLIALIDRLVGGPKSMCKQAYLNNSQILQVVDMIRGIKSDEIGLVPAGKTKT